MERVEGQGSEGAGRGQLEAQKVFGKKQKFCDLLVANIDFHMRDG